MEQFPKIAKARLRGLRADLHPDAEELNAFAENALAAQERESVLEHLSACGDCRDAVALALAARPSDATLTKPARGGFRWATFQWAAVAASVAIVTVAVLVVGPRQQQTPQRATETAALRQEPAAAAPQAKAQKVSPNASTGPPASPAREQKPTPGQEPAGKRDKDSRNGTGLENGYVADGVNITDGGFGGIGVYSRIYQGKQTEKASSPPPSPAKSADATGGAGANFDKSTGGIVRVVPSDEKKKEAAQEGRGAAAGQRRMRRISPLQIRLRYKALPRKYRRLLPRRKMPSSFAQTLARKRAMRSARAGRNRAQRQPQPT